MATQTVITHGNPRGAFEAVLVEADNTKFDAKASAAKISSVEIDNTNNSSEAAFVQIFDAASGAVTLGTTDPVMQIPCAAGKRVKVNCLDITNNQGVACCATALCIAVTSAKWGTASLTGNKPTVRVRFD